MRVERKNSLELFLGFAKVYKNSRQIYCVGAEPIDFTVLVVQCAGPHAHDPRAYWEEILSKEPLAELQLMVGRRSERVQCVDLEELDKRM